MPGGVEEHMHQQYHDIVVPQSFAQKDILPDRTGETDLPRIPVVFQTRNLATMSETSLFWLTVVTLRQCFEGRGIGPVAIMVISVTIEWPASHPDVLILSARPIDPSPVAGGVHKPCSIPRYNCHVPPPEGFGAAPKMTGGSELIHWLKV